MQRGPREFFHFKMLKYVKFLIFLPWKLFFILFLIKFRELIFHQQFCLRFFVGRPEPTVTWFMGTTPIQTGGGVSMGRHVTVNRLEIQHVKRDALNNTYVCQASNTKLVPPAERTVRVEMLRKCQKDHCKKFRIHKFSSPSNQNHYTEYIHIITVQNIFPIHNQNLFLQHIWKLCKLF